ncbi:MAG TPA: hypothetical protein VFO03_11805 [Gaiellaceae bacterium]|nr:hypothetical protein [Gaiellaceae bacterium]
MGKVIILLTLALAVAFAPSAPAKSGPGVLRQGQCTGGGTWKLKAKRDEARIEVEFEVDQNVVGQRWNVALRRNRTTVFRGVRVTRAPSGSFSVTRRIADRPGRDRIVATAVRAGRTCRGAVSL